MEPETLFMKQEDNVKTANPVETNAEGVKSEENTNVEVDVIALEADQPAVVAYVPLVPDLTLFSYDVQQGYRIFRELMSEQYKSITYPFIEPVDVEALGLWDYNTRIETPMSFSQIENKFKDYLYQSITEVVSDMRLILENCYRYNGLAHWITKLAQKLEKVLDQKLALLNRSLREKVSLHATMAFRNKKDITEELTESGRRRRSGRSSYMNGMSSDKSSSLMNHLLMQEEENQKEIKRLKEKEKKEANEALMQELSEWENEIFTKNVLKELRSMWEIPAVGSFVWLFWPALNLPELNFTEFEHSFVLPHKSQQMAWIFTTLLVTPSQRKSLHKKSPMKYKVWERKLKERMDVWYLTRQDEELEMVGQQIGLNSTSFEILGETNPLETKSYIDLTLHQRVLILKILCDDCLDCQPQLRDYVGNTETTPYRETYLGYDGENNTYLHFPIFDLTDIRVYKQAELPSFKEWHKKWSSNSKAVSGSYQTPKRTNQSKSRRSSTSKSSKKSKGLSTTIEPGFELVCNDVESLRELCEKFSEHPTTPSRKKGRNRPPRKRSEKELYKVLSGLVDELASSDARFSRARVKGMLNLMKDWKSVEETSDFGDEYNVEEGENEETTSASFETPLDNGIMTTAPDIADTEDLPVQGGAPLLSMVTRSRNRKRKFLDYDDITSASSSPVSVVSKNFESDSGTFDDNQDGRVELSEKRRLLGSNAFHDSVKNNTEMCDVIVRDVLNDVLLKVLASENVVMKSNTVDSEGQVTAPVSRCDKQEHNGDTLGVYSNGSGVEKCQIYDGVSMDNGELQKIGADQKHKEIGGKMDTTIHLDGFEANDNHATLTENKSNGSASMTNGNMPEHEELIQNVQPHLKSSDNDLDHTLHASNELNTCTSPKEMKSSISLTGQNCPRTQEVNEGTKCADATNAYNNGHFCEATNGCNGVLSMDGHYAVGAGLPTEKEHTGNVPTGEKLTRTVATEKEPRGIMATEIFPAESESTGSEPIGINSGLMLSKGKSNDSDADIRYQSPVDTAI